MKASRLLILLENSITLSRYSFNFASLNNIEIILLYPEQDQEAIRPYLNHFLKSYPIEHACDVMDYAEGEASKLDFKYNALIKRVKSILQKYDKKNTIVLSSFEFYSLALAKLRAQLAIPGIREKNVLPYRDKAIMSQYLLETARLPKTMRFDFAYSNANPKISFKQLTENLSNSFIIKPASGSSSIGVYKITSFRDYVKTLTKLNKNIIYIVQEFISTALYHVDISMKNSKLIFSAACRYTNSLLPSDKPIIVGSIPVTDEGMSEMFFKESRAIIRALGPHDGFFHLEFFYNGRGRPIFLECGHRPGGGYLSHLYEIMYGFNMYDVNLILAVSIDPHQQVFDTIYQLGFAAYIFPTKKLSMNFFDMKSNFSIKNQQHFYECLLWNKNEKMLLKDIKIFKNLAKNRKK